MSCATYKAQEASEAEKEDVEGVEDEANREATCVRMHVFVRLSGGNRFVLHSASVVVATAVIVM